MAITDTFTNIFCSLLFCRCVDIIQTGSIKNSIHSISHVQIEAQIIHTSMTIWSIACLISKIVIPISFLFISPSFCRIHWFDILNFISHGNDLVGMFTVHCSLFSCLFWKCGFVQIKVVLESITESI